MSSVFLLDPARDRDGSRARAGRNHREGDRREEHVRDARLGLGIVFAAMTVVFARARVSDAGARAAARRRPRCGAVRRPTSDGARDPGAQVRLGGGDRARPPALARRRRDRRRRSLPPRPGAQAPRVRRPAPLVRERVRRRRAPPGLRLPALAGVPRADREGRLRRSVEGRAARGKRAGAPRGAGRLRGGLRALPPGRARGGVGRCGGRDRRHGRRARRLVHLACAARHLVAPAPRAGRARPCLRGAARPDERAARERRRRVARARRRPPDLRDLPLDPVCRLPRRALGLAVREVRQRLPHPRRPRRAAGLFLAWLLPVVRKTASVSPDAHERARGFEHYAGQLNGSADQFWVAPQVSAARARLPSPRCS